jgi:WD40 repeat protein
LVFWDLREWKEIAVVAGVDPSTTSLRFSPNGRYLGTYGFYGGVEVWDVQTRKHLGHVPSATPLFGFGPTSEQIVTAGRSFRFWNIRDLPKGITKKESPRRADKRARN